MIISYMFLSFVPILIACLALYCSSNKQKLLRHSLSRKVALVVAALLFALSIVIMSQRVPLISAMIAAIGLFCCFLPLLTIASAYGKKITFSVIGILSCSSLILTFVEVRL